MATLLETEQRIKDTTIKLLLKNGKFGASLMEIAELAEVSRTVIHYYFRSREGLFAAVNKEIIEKIIVPRNNILFGDKPIHLKIEDFLKVSEKNGQLYPLVDVYCVSEYENSIEIRDYFLSLKCQMSALIDEIKRGIQQKIIPHTDPVLFVVELFSLAGYSNVFLNFLDTHKKTLGFEEYIDLNKIRTAKLQKLLFV